MSPLRHGTPTSIVTTLPTDDGALILDEFLDDSDTIATPTKELTAKELKLIADAVAQTVEKIASDFESARCWCRFDQAAARVRSMRALRPKKAAAGKRARRAA